MDLGYDLFLDRGKLKANFIVGGVFKDNGPWDEINGIVDILNVAVSAAAEGVMIVSHQMGSLTLGEFPSLRKGTTGFRHNVEMLQMLWNEVGARSGSKWLVEGLLDTVGIMGTGEKKDEKERPAWLLFTITRQ
ncbi:hypothetical protein VTN77DRAFT_136 [Rasamsonia byssochlamydoides]|uniref:uncharacterized protein n=1 Tax=Rasamsonia byssochlamydoides TaxID=89139 RepID=UPI0037446CBA